ncbi:uncharacterized protein V6R79_011663 [Siganus canaliculatus]
MPANANLALFVFILVQIWVQRRKRFDRQRRLRRIALARLARRRHINIHSTQYCCLNRQLPVLAIYFDGQTTCGQTFGSPDQHATSYRVVSQAFGIPRSTVNDIAHRMADKILTLKNRVIRFPSPDELQQIGAGFQRLAGSAAFGRVVGSIDGCHIRIKPPSADAQCYFNRKLFYSVQLQAVCDHQCQFLDLFVGYPGSVHDARVLKNSPLYVHSLYQPEGYYILGDGGYPCMSEPMAIITPYREPVRNAVAARFNRHHSKARSIIERAFGIMKTRWRSIFFKALEVHHVFAVRIIECCAILHNICLKNGDNLEPTEEALEPQDGDGLPQADLQCGERLRSRMAAALSALTDAPPALHDHDYY